MSMENVARTLSEISIPTRVEFVWLGQRKTLNADQKAEIAETMGADVRWVSGGKRLLNTRHEWVKPVHFIKSEAQGYWHAMTVPHPERGIRLLRRDKIAEFDQRMDLYLRTTVSSAAGMQEHREEVLEEAEQRLGHKLFNRADYPSNFSGAFGIHWSYPSVEPPNYLLSLAPELYERMKQAAQAQFVEAACLAEQDFLETFAGLIERLGSALQGKDDGTPKVIKEAHLAGLGEFFERFRSLSLQSLPELETLVDRAQATIQGVSRTDLRDSNTMRNQVRRAIDEIGTSVEQLMVSRPTRRIRSFDDAPEAVEVQS